MFLAALPWTYWMALPLLVGSATMLVAFALVYLKKVVEPHVLRMDALAVARTSASFTAAGAHPAALPSGVGAERRGW